MALGRYGAFLDAYDSTDSFWKTHLFRTHDAAPVWEDNNHDSNWFGKVRRWLKGEHHSVVIPQILKIERDLAEAYEKENNSENKARLLPYLTKYVHLLQHYHSDVVQIHNERRWFKTDPSKSQT